MDNFTHTTVDGDPGSSTSSTVVAEVAEQKTLFEIVGSDGQSIIIEAPPGSVHVDEHGNTVLYDVDLDGVFSTPDVGFEEVVEQEIVVDEEIETVQEIETTTEDWNDDIGQKHERSSILNSRRTYVKENFKHPTVLMSSKSLVAHPSYIPKAGPRHRNIDVKDIATPGPSGLNRDIPLMKNMFKVYSQSALTKATETCLIDDGDSDDVGRKNDLLVEDSSQPVDHDLPVDDADLEGMDSSVTAFPMEPVKKTRIRRTSKDNFEKWPLYWDHPVTFEEACEILVGIRSVATEKISTSVPKKVREDSTFVVDVRSLVSRHHILYDDMGSWGRPSSRCRYYAMSKEGDLVRADDGRGQLRNWVTDYVFKCMLKRYEKTIVLDKKQYRFEKKVYTATSPPHKKTSVALAVVTYSWGGDAPPGEPEFENEFSSAKKHNVSEYLPMRGWESASMENALPGTLSAYFDGMPLYAHGAIDFSEAAAILLGGTIVEPARIANGVPKGYRGNGSFVIDTKKLISPNEIRVDDNGLWGKPAGYSRYYKLDDASGDAVRVDKSGKLLEGIEYDIQIVLKRYEHPQVDKKFVRKTYLARGKVNDDFPGNPFLAVIVYYWKGHPEYFEPMHKQNQVSAVLKPVEVDEDEFVDTNQDDDEVGMSLDELPSNKRRRLDDQEDVNAVRLAACKKELENQERLSSILDRAEGLLDRLERNV